MEFKAKLIRIGNSKGIIIPSKVIKALGEKKEYLVNVETINGHNEEMKLDDINDLFMKKELNESFIKKDDTNE